MSTNTINVLVGLTRASVQKIHYGCFKIVLRAVKCVREFLVSEHSIVLWVVVVVMVTFHYKLLSAF